MGKAFCNGNNKAAGRVKHFSFNKFIRSVLVYIKCFKSSNELSVIGPAQ
jgi:hypothetical protein